MTDHVKIVRDGACGRITLNRPEALHALNEPMCRSILDAVTAWQADAAIDFVLIDHLEGSRGFCAGGDIRMLAESGAADGKEARAFFATEYRMNTALHNFPKPIISMIDGVTMGGGVGLSVHGSHRVATERTLFAMPETGIGLFPDVGGGWFLPRLDGEIGMWLALTGARLKGADVYHSGVATHFVSSEGVSDLKARIIAEGPGALSALSAPEGEASYAAEMDTINRCFAGDRAEDMRDALAADGGEWAQKQLGFLKTKSPRTVKVALRQLREGARFDRFEDNMINEYRIGARQVQSADFIEGVRAVIIDKDHAPRWVHARLEEVPGELLDEVFAPLPAGEELTFDV